jgi:DNA-binding response OmpR family regulator
MDPTSELQLLVSQVSTVLLVDEDVHTRAIAEGFLTDYGVRVIAVSGLAAAVHVMRAVEIDLIVARYDDEQAQAAASALRACGGSTPIIALSAGADTLRALLEALGKAIGQALLAQAPN